MPTPQEELLAQLQATMQPQAQAQSQSKEELLAQLKEVSENPIDWENLPEVGGAPELNDLTAARSYWAALGLMMSGDNEKASKIVKEHIPEAEIIGRGPNTAIKLPSGTYIANRPGMSWQDASSGLFNLLEYFPASKIFGTSAKQLGKGALASGATATAHEAGLVGLGGDFDPSESAMNVGLAAGMAPVSQLAAEPIARVASKVVQQPLAKLGTRISDYTKQAVKGDPSQEAQAILKSGDEYGVPVLTSDVLPPDTFAKKIAQKMGERIPFVGTGPVRSAQSEARQQAVGKLAAKFGADTDDNLLELMASDLKKQSAAKFEKAAGLRNSANTVLDKSGNVPMTKAQEAIKKAIEKESSFGARADQGVLDDLANLAQSPAGNMTFTTELRSRLGDDISSMYKGEHKVLPSRFVPYYQQVKSAMTEDMEVFAKNAGDPKAFKQWQRANKLFSEEYGNVKNSALKKVFEKGDVEPEVIKSLLKEATPSKTRLLFKALSPKGREHARSHILADFLKTSAGSPTKFTNLLKKNNDVITTLFKGKDARTLVGFKKLMDATKRGSEAGVSTASGQEAAAMGGLATGIYAPLPALAAGGTIGALSRVYESKPVRNLLLRLANTPKTNRNYDELIRKINAVMLPILQSEVE